MIRKEEGMERWQPTFNDNGSMDAGSDHGSAAKGSAIYVVVAGSGPVACQFSSFLTIISSSPTCLSFILQRYADLCITLVVLYINAGQRIGHHNRMRTASVWHGLSKIILYM